MGESPSSCVSQMKRSRARALPRAHKWLAETPMSGSRPTPHTHPSGSFQNCCLSRWPLGCGALKLNPGPAPGCPWTPPHNPCTEGPSVCIQDSPEGCYSGSLLPLGSPSWAGPGSVPCCALAAVCQLPEVIAMFAAPFLVWKDVEAGEAGEKAVLTGCDQPLLQSRVSEGRAGWPRGLCLASAPALQDPVQVSSSRPCRLSTAARPLPRSPGPPSTSDRPLNEPAPPASSPPAPCQSFLMSNSNLWLWHNALSS